MAQPEGKRSGFYLRMSPKLLRRLKVAANRYQERTNQFIGASGMTRRALRSYLDLSEDDPGE